MAVKKVPHIQGQRSIVVNVEKSSMSLSIFKVSICSVQDVSRKKKK